MGAGASKLDTEGLDNKCEADVDKSAKDDTPGNLDVNSKVKVDLEYNEDSQAADNDKDMAKDEDTVSMDSKDSNDTYVLSLRMPKYLLEKRHRMQNENKLGKDGPVQTKEVELSTFERLDKTTSNTNSIYENKLDSPEQRQSAFCKNEDMTSSTVLSAKENNCTDNKEDMASTPQPNTSSARSNDRTNIRTFKDGSNESNVITKCEANMSKNNVSLSNEQTEKNLHKFEEFKRNYGIQFRRRKSIANKQTLILTKVGTKFQLITVPAYLPNQRLYRSSSFVRYYIPDSPVFRRKSKSILCFR